jgi:hypothetical protein
MEGSKREGYTSGCCNGSRIRIIQYTALNESDRKVTKSAVYCIVDAMYPYHEPYNPIPKARPFESVNVRVRPYRLSPSTTSISSIVPFVPSEKISIPAKRQLMHGSSRGIRDVPDESESMRRFNLLPVSVGSSYAPISAFHSALFPPQRMGRGNTPFASDPIPSRKPKRPCPTTLS